MTDLLKTWQIHCSTKQNLTHLILTPWKGTPGCWGSQGASGSCRHPTETTSDWTLWDPNPLAHPSPKFGMAFKEVSSDRDFQIQLGRVWIHTEGHTSIASHQQRGFPLPYSRMVTQSLHLIPFPVLIPPSQKFLGSSNLPEPP